MSAVVSACGTYRYRLDRDVQSEGLVFAYFGINPSTADASVDDATVRKWRGFTQRNGGRKFIVGNVFAYRATDVGELKLTGLDLFGPEWGEHVAQIISEADVIVPCWGGVATKVPKPLRHIPAELLTYLRTSGKPIRCFGFTDAGDPRHPLMLGYDTPLEVWE